MAADPLEARIKELELQVFHPSCYCTGVLATSDADGAEGRQGYAHLCAELERLYRMRQTQAAEKWWELAPIDGWRLSSGHLPGPEPEEPASWKDSGRDYDPWLRAAEEFG